MDSIIQSIIDDVLKKQTSVREVILTALERAEAKKEYNALLSLDREGALKKAEELDARISRGEAKGRLLGVPFVAKDNFLSFGGPTTAASHFLEGFRSPLQATAIEKLENEGAICIGKANLDAFAHGGSTENSAFGPVKNAHDTTRVAGGSSGGSAVAVALDIVPFAVGTDTGGSIRQPASFNGVVGVKPTYGAVSRFGVVAMASSTDCVGPITKTVSDAERVLEVLAGQDERDGVTLPDYFAPIHEPKKKYTIGVIKECFGDGLDHEVKEKVESYIEALQQQGHHVSEVNIPTLPYSLAMYYIIVPAEVSSNLARYDGVRYGKRESDTNLSSLYETSRDLGFEAENKRRILIGSYVLSSGYYDAYYTRAQKARTLLIQDFEKALKECDVLISPTAPTPAFKLGEKINDPVTMYLSDIMTVAPSLAGLPAVSVPVQSDKNELPIGVQIIGSRQSDADILNLAKSMEDIH